MQQSKNEYNFMQFPSWLEKCCKSILGYSFNAADFGNK